MGTRAPLRLGVLVSGEGTTLEAIARAVEGAALPARVVLVGTDRAGVPAVARAQRHGIPVVVASPVDGPPGAWQERLSRALREAGAELVVLAGFLRVLGPAFLRDWEGRAINLHPSLLPKFGGPGMYGRRVHHAVLASGDRVTGATVHLVTAALDRGPVLVRAELEVRPGESAEELATRQRPLEHALLIEAIGRFARGLLPLPYPAPGAVAADPAPRRGAP